MALRHNLVIISDEIYEKVLYDGFEHISIATLSPEVAARTVVINGVSKAYAMTGWRIGYAGPKPLLTAMANIQSQSTSNPCSISQKAAVAALRLAAPFTKIMVAEFDRRRRVMVDRLNRMPGVTCSMPTGAFYAFPNVSGLLARRWGRIGRSALPPTWQPICSTRLKWQSSPVNRLEVDPIFGCPMPLPWRASSEG